ncbi:MAG: hypothetical protein M1837_001934 [Sclerophora amabilis]|nr:MAG: hypothetical protein M1837_001934 [Sclerophora amabilis]
MADSAGMSGAGGGGAGSAISSAQPSPTSLRAGPAGKRDRSAAGYDSSPESIDDGGEDERSDDRKRTLGVKMQHRRACNECRQQKVSRVAGILETRPWQIYAETVVDFGLRMLGSCMAIILSDDQDSDEGNPWSPCDRCQRLKLHCKIESNFKRIGKRSKHAEMEREIVELRRRLNAYEAQISPGHQQPPMFNLPTSASISPALYQMPTQPDPFLSPNEAVASLIDLRQGLDGGTGFLKSPNGMAIGTRKIGNAVLTGDQVTELFQQFFTFYHPFLPILDPQRPPDYYFNTCELLFWTVITVAARRSPPYPNLLSVLAPAVSKLVWSTLGEVPQSYHVVKALCLICTWPLPTSSTSTDPTFMLSGVMMQIALQIGLHRPSHCQDFTRFQVQLRDEELRDRVKTWATCNIVAQSVGTGYGQPPATIYDWTLEPSPTKDPSYKLPQELAARLRIEKFCDKVTKGLYSTRADPVGLTNDEERSSFTGLLAREFESLEMEFGPEISSINKLHLHAASLHLRLSAFLDSSSSRDYNRDLFNLYFTVLRFLECALNLENPHGVLRYATNYILQMIIAGSFALLKLLNSFFAHLIDFESGKRLFQRTIWAIRKISVLSNDLPSRLAEVLAQLWRGGGAEARISSGRDDLEMDRSLQLKVRCRMSMSLVFDSVWRWREEFQAKGRGNLDSAVKNPTNPDSAAESSASSSIVDPGLAPPPPLQPGPGSVPNLVGLMANGNGGTAGGAASGSGTLTPSLSNGGFAESTYEVFDPLNWMLDGVMDFPYTAVQNGGLLGIEAQGMA